MVHARIWKRIALNVAAVLLLAVLIEWLTPAVYLTDLVGLGLVLVPFAFGLYFQAKFYPRVYYTPRERRLMYRIGAGLFVFGLLWLGGCLIGSAEGLHSPISVDLLLFPFLAAMIASLGLIYMAFISPRE